MPLIIDILDNTVKYLAYSWVRISILFFLFTLDVQIWCFPLFWS